MNKRSTIDIVVIIFAAVVAVSIIAAIVMVSIISVVSPSVDTSTTLDYVYGVVTTILGSLIGLIAGQAKGRADAKVEDTDNG